MSLRSALIKNSDVTVPNTDDIRVCRKFVVQLGDISQMPNQELPDLFDIKLASQIIRTCAPRGVPAPEKTIGQGSFGRVYALKGNKLVMKLQIFQISKRMEDQVGEMFLGRLFGANGIGPKNYASGILMTDNTDIGVSFIVMEKGVSLDKVLKKSGPANKNSKMKQKIMNQISKQFLNHMNRMLTMGFACVDLKAHNSLFNMNNGKLYMIDFSLLLCPQVPTILDRYTKTVGNKIASLLPKRMRRDIIACQTIMYHCTMKLWYKTSFARKIVNKIIENQPVFNNCHKMLCLGIVPDDYALLSNQEQVNGALFEFLRKFSYYLSLNFLSYTRMNEVGNSLEIFLHLLELRV